MHTYGSPAGEALVGAYTSRVSFRGVGGEGCSPPFNLFWPPLIEIAVVLFLRSNPFLASPYDKKQSFRPPWNDF